MFSRILVPLDGSELAEQVLPYVASLAKALQADVSLITAMIPVRPLPESFMEQASVNLHQLTTEYLAARADTLRERGLIVDWSVEDGYPSEVIATAALKQPNTLIAISTHGRSGLTRWTLGSVTDRVVHSTKAPLLIIRSRDEDQPAEATLTTVIVPLDGSGLGEQALAPAAALAKALGLNITLVRATPSAADYYKFATYPVPVSEDYSKEVDEDAGAYLAGVKETLQKEGSVSVETALEHGSPAAVIVDLAKNTPDSLVVMTTHGRSGMGRWILGSVTDRVVRHSGDPVLVIHGEE
ncbi:MAG: Nucleotide-binding universal stress protein, UspA family [Chloroflexi bacterium]|jgi:nucleotide-binding universal stress UspA family protein|nr:MAG: Nucleotide-binding universal stress protein, UspA family [Chloroflexota bacterium]